MRPRVTPGPDRGNETPTAAGSDTEDDVVGEARWPMAGAVLAAMVLTILLPGTLRLGPKWVLPLIEGLLLAAVIAGDPVTISRRSRELRALSIGLVSVLVLGALWSTGNSTAGARRRAPTSFRPTPTSRSPSISTRTSHLPTGAPGLSTTCTSVSPTRPPSARPTSCRSCPGRRSRWRSSRLSRSASSGSSSRGP
jgi:hypothetical protein